ncbi:MAG: NAD(+)--dinitrogen-reductase ADP-D-ribosyltransferase [Verrucomicrobia bacterium]|nr:NAD(+)--dinitrogen-reductase ADP-D-ribosyltransferase [Verrucomicrobiota bacterium]
MDSVQINHCTVSPWIITKQDFNEQPRTLHLCGVRESNRTLFDKLDTLGEPAQRGKVFHDYLSVKFALHQWPQYEGNARRSLLNSYVRFLRGWSMNSSSVEAAVLKGWVQSRFGIAPTHHKRSLDHQLQEEDQEFARDRMKGSARTNAIFSQLDLLFEYCQYELKRRLGGVRSLVLYRAKGDPAEHPVLMREGLTTTCVRMNNLVTFTSDREHAWEFGDTIWQCTVASSKILFFSGLLPPELLPPDDCYLVIGGEYRVHALRY